MKKFHFKSSVSQEESPTLLRLERRHTLMNVDNNSVDRQRMAAPVASPVNVELKDLGNSSEGSSMKRRIQAKLSRDKANSECSPASSVVITDSDLSSSWIYKKAALACNDTFDSNQTDPISPLLAPRSPRSTRERSRSPKFYLPDRKMIPVAKHAQSCSTCCWVFTILLFVFISTLGIMSAISGIVYLEVFATEKSPPEVDFSAKVPLVYKPVRTHVGREKTVEATHPAMMETSTSLPHDLEDLNEKTLSSSEISYRNLMLDENEPNLGDTSRQNERDPLNLIVERQLSRLNITLADLSDDRISKDSSVDTKVDSFKEADVKLNHDFSKHHEQNYNIEDSLLRNMDNQNASENSMETQNLHKISLNEDIIVNSNTKSKDTEAEYQDADTNSNHLSKAFRESTKESSDQNVTDSLNLDIVRVAFSPEPDIMPSDIHGKKFISNVNFEETTTGFDHKAAHGVSSPMPMNTKSQTSDFSLENLLSDSQDQNIHSRALNFDLIPNRSGEFNIEVSSSDSKEAGSMIVHPGAGSHSKLEVPVTNTTKDLNAIASDFETGVTESILHVDIAPAHITDDEESSSSTSSLVEAHITSPISNPFSDLGHADSVADHDDHLAIQHHGNDHSQDEFDTPQGPIKDAEHLGDSNPFVVTGVAPTIPLEMFRRLDIKEQPSVDFHSNQRNFLAMQSSLADAVRHLQHLNPTNQFPASRVQSVSERNRLRNHQHSPRRSNVRTQSDFSAEATLERIRYLERLRRMMYDNE